LTLNDFVPAYIKRRQLSMSSEQLTISTEEEFRRKPLAKGGKALQGDNETAFSVRRQIAQNPS
jgi:hypothetical protein